MEQLASGPFGYIRDGSEIEALSPETVAVRAYELWMKRGCPIGSAEVDWYQAETELAEEAAQSRRPVSQAKAA